MARAVKIDFDNTYETKSLSDDLRIISFNTVLDDNSQTGLKVEISKESHELLHNVYNLAFGPVDKRGRINDKAVHQRCGGHSNGISSAIAGNQQGIAFGRIEKLVTGVEVIRGIGENAGILV